MNPILEADQALTASGKRIVGVFFDTLYKPSRVTFHCDDGTTHDVRLEVSHKQFMERWKQTAAYVKAKRAR